MKTTHNSKKMQQQNLYYYYFLTLNFCQYRENNTHLLLQEQGEVESPQY